MVKILETLVVLDTRLPLLHLPVAMHVLLDMKEPQLRHVQGLQEHWLMDV